MKNSIIILAAATLISCCEQINNRNAMKNVKLVKAPVSEGLGTLNISFDRFVFSVPLYRTENDTMPFDTLSGSQFTFGSWSLETKRLKSFNPYEMYHGTITLEEDAGKGLPYYPPRLAFRVVEATDRFWRVVVDEQSFETVVIQNDRNFLHIYKKWEECRNN